MRIDRLSDWFCLYEFFILGLNVSDCQDERKRAAWDRESGTSASDPVFIYTTKDSSLRFLAPKHTSRLLFQSEVPHSAKRLGDRTEASWGQRTSVQTPSLYVTFHTSATSARRGRRKFVPKKLFSRKIYVHDLKLVCVNVGQTHSSSFTEETVSGEPQVADSDLRGEKCI